MSQSLSFIVLGQPVPQGSVKAFMPKGWTRPVLTSTSGPKLKSWRRDVAATAMQHCAGARWDADGAFELCVDFYLPRPKSVSRTKRPLPICKPDADKLLRATCDALTGVVWNDDAQAVSQTARKHYADGGAVRTEITVKRVVS